MNTNKIIGERIKLLRESKSITPEEMAERSGLSVEQIARIEGDIDFPSLAPLIKIARVLGVRLGTFLDDHDESGPVVSRKQTHRESIHFSNNRTDQRTDMDYFALSPDKTGRSMEPFIIHINASQNKEFTLSSHEGEEFIYCLEGIVEIQYGAQTYVLEEGDSIYYDSIVMHHVHAADEQEAKTGAGWSLQKIRDLLKEAYAGEKIIVLGPAPAAVPRVAGKYRERLIIKCKNTKRFRELVTTVSHAFRQIPAHKNVQLVIEMNPYNI